MRLSFDILYTFTFKLDASLFCIIHCRRNQHLINHLNDTIVGQDICGDNSNIITNLDSKYSDEEGKKKQYHI